MALEYLTAEEVARRLKTTTPTVRRWIREGRLPAIRVGDRFLRLEWSAVLASLQGGSGSQTDDALASRVESKP